MDQSKPTEVDKRAATRRRRIRQALFIAAGLVTAFVTVAASASIVFLWRADRALERRDIPALDPEPTSRDPINVLILGSDTREGLSKEEQARKGSPEDLDGERSDTLILAHLDPRAEDAVLVHFPRDLRVEIPGRGVNKINEAFHAGGPDLTVRTVQGFTGIPIHHYVEVGFNGFRGIVESLGGVEICVDRPMVDELAELNLPKAGCYDFDGDTALAFVRARNVQGDIIPDFARIARQQQFIRAVMNKIFSFGSVPKFPSLLTAAARNVITDQDISVTDLVDLGQDLRGLGEIDEKTGETAVDLRVVPGRTETIEGISFVIAEQPNTNRLFKRLENGRPLGALGTVQALTPVSPALIRVRVLDAGGPAREAEERLRAAGFVVLCGEPAPAGSRESVVLHAKGARPRGRVTGRFFSGLEVRRGSATELGGADVAVVIGPNWREPPS